MATLFPTDFHQRGNNQNYLQHHHHHYPAIHSNRGINTYNLFSNTINVSPRIIRILYNKNKLTPKKDESDLLL